MPSADGRLAVVLDGAIANRAALADELLSRGRRLRTARSEELLLHLWDIEGPEMLWRLAGSFAFALWDARRSGLLLARDGLGVRPLYMAAGAFGVVVASRVRDVAAVDGVVLDPCPAGHIGFHLHGHVPEPFTLHRGIKAVPSGGAIWIDGHGTRPVGRFWSTASRLVPMVSGPSVPSGPRARRRALEAAVQRSLSAQCPRAGGVVAALSGGPVSAALAGLAAGTDRLLGAVAVAGAAGRRKPSPDAAAAALGVDLRRVGIDDADRDGAGLPEALEWLEVADQPSLSAPVFALAAAAAAEAGATGLLVGCGGEALFGAGGLNRPGGGFPNLTRAMRRRVLMPLAEAGLLARGAVPDLDPGGDADPRRALGHLEPDFVRAGLDALAAAEPDLSRLPPRTRAIARQLEGAVRDGPLRDAQRACEAAGLALVAPLMDTRLIDRLGPWLAAPDAPDARFLLALGCPDLLGEPPDRPAGGEGMSAVLLGRHLFSRALARDRGPAESLSAALLARSSAALGAFPR